MSSENARTITHLVLSIPPIQGQDPILQFSTTQNEIATLVECSAENLECIVTAHATSEMKNWRPGHFQTGAVIKTGEKEIILPAMLLCKTEYRDQQILQTWLPMERLQFVYSTKPDTALPIQGHKNNVNLGKRKSDRVGYRPTDSIQIEISAQGLQWSGHVFDLSSFGFSITFDDSHAKLLHQAHVSVRLWNHAFQSSPLSARVVWKQPTRDGKTRVGYAFIQPDCNFRVSHLTPINLPEKNSLPGFFKRSLFYFENAQFRVLSICHDEMLLVIHGSDAVLLPEAEVTIHLYVQTSRGNDEPIHGQIVSVSHLNQDHLLARIKISKLPPDTEQDIVGYLINFAKISPRQLKAAGFKFRKIAEAFQFRSVETNDQYYEVLKLRHLAYLDAGKLAATKNPQDMAAPLDHKSRIITVRHKGLLVASVALSFPDDERLILDTERALPHGYPADFPEKTKVIEISRLCTHPDYRGGDLLHRLFEHIYKIFATSGREYIVSSTDERLWPLYQKLGFKKTGMRYNHPSLAGIVHDIILVKLEIGTASNGINPLVWAYLYGDMTQELVDNNKIQIGLRSRFKQFIGRLLCRLLLMLRG